MTDSRRSEGDHLHLPSRAGRVAIEEFTRRNATQVRFDWGVPSLDAYLTPMIRGDLVTIMARPGHGKTSLAIHALRRANQLLKGEKSDVKRYAVYITWETLVEEFVAIRLANLSGQTLQDIGRGQADLEKLERAIAASVTDRVAVIGTSMETQTGQKTLGMPTLSSVNETLHRMAENGTPAAFLVFDYLQRIPGRPGQDRTQTVPENLEAIKDIGLRYGVPSIVAVQSKRDVDEYKGLQMPTLSDGQWSSNIEQTSDKIICATLPSKYLEVNKTITIGDDTYRITSNLMAVKIPKQRWADAGATMMLNFDPKKGTLTDANPMDPNDEDGPIF